MSEQLAVKESNGHQLATMTIKDLLAQVAMVQEVMGSVMKDGQHYGKVPGCGDKPTLLKPGAEKLAFVFRLNPEFDVKEENLPGGHRTYTILCTMKQIGSGQTLGQGVGVGSTMEAKYRFRTGPKTLTGKPVPKEYWDLRQANPQKAAELIGKGHTVAKNDAGMWEIAEGGSKVEHDNPADYYNTVLKMAKKRAQIDATLTCTAASDIFTQDLEDIRDNQAAHAGDAIEVKTTPVANGSNGSNGAKTAPAATQTPAATNTPQNGHRTAAAGPSSNWRGVALHFSKHKGKTLGELEPRSLEWFIEKWQPQGFNGRPPSSNDTTLRAALDAARHELIGGGAKDAEVVQDHPADVEAKTKPAAQPENLDEDVPF
jgi:hypothetical protein